MKRRRFIQTIAAAPALAVPVAPALPAQQPAAPANSPPQTVAELPKVEFAVPDVAAENTIE